MSKAEMTARIPVLEIFGPTIQGEGMVIGQKTMFIRTAGCDYRCSWCDSAFTWDGTGKALIEQMTAQQIWSELKRIGEDRFSHVTISGGNPLLYRHMGEVVQLLQEQGIRTAVETQGSIWQDWLLRVDDVTLSPKPPSSGMVTDFAILDSIIEKLSSQQSRGRFSLKVVVFDSADFSYAQKVHKRYPDAPFYVQTGNADVTTEDQAALLPQLLQQYEWLIKQVEASSAMNHVRVLPQLHTLLWGNKRGV